jgi:hypothetical protein
MSGTIAEAPPARERGARPRGPAPPVPARGLYVTEPEFAELDAAVTKWAQTAVPLIRRALP